MATNTSFLTLEGALSGLIFYVRDGRNLVRRKNGISKSRILNDPAFARTRENMSEFGGAAKVGKAMRTGFGSLIGTLGDTYLSARLNALMKRINTLSSGKRGMRAIDVAAHGALLEGFEFNSKAPFDTHFRISIARPTINASRNRVTWVIPSFNAHTSIKAPEGATHFKFVLGACFVSTYTFSEPLKHYVPEDTSVNGQGAHVASTAIDLLGMVGAPITLDFNLSSFGSIPVNSRLLVAIGLKFYQEVNDSLYALKQGHCMTVATSA